MSSLEATVIVGGAIIVWQIVGIRHNLEDGVRILKDCMKELEKIREEISNKYANTPTGLQLGEWGIKHTLKEIQEGICTEYEQTPAGPRVAQWGLREIAENIQSELREIKEELRST